MKAKKLFGVFALLLALTVVGCGQAQSSSAAASSSAKPSSVAPSSQSSAAPSSSEAPSSSKEAAPHPAEPTWPETCPALIDTSAWTAGTPVANSYGKNYTPLTSADGKVGVKIAVADYDPDSASTFDSDGKLGTSSDSYVTFKLKAPKAGVYQMIIKASCSSSGDSYIFAGSSSRGFDVLVNGYDDQDNVYGDRLYTDAGLDHDEKRAFIFALVQLNGPSYEDEISFRNPYYRMKFDTSSDLIFAEN